MGQCRRPSARSRSRLGQATLSATFTYSARSELSAAVLAGSPYAYAYDDIGNRNSAPKGSAASVAYTTNAHNQYAVIQGDSDFEPQYDADGNQTLVQTATGIRQVDYNALDRPVRWTSLDGATVVECAYDYRGRRTMKKVTANGFVTQHQYFVHRGYQVIAAIDATTSNPDWQLVWDPAYATAARPLAFCRGDQVYTYGFDQTKNVCELFAESGQIATSYDYAPTEPSSSRREDAKEYLY